MFLLFISSISSNSSTFFFEAAAALATKYGGNSPRAVPNPHRKASNYRDMSI